MAFWRRGIINRLLPLFVVPSFILLLFVFMQYSQTPLFSISTNMDFINNDFRNKIWNLKENTKKNDQHLYKEHLLKRDWHDIEAINAELSRTGLGERGEPAFVTKNLSGKVKAAISESFYKYGINGYLSDLISVNRSVPDHRFEICKSATYLASLPKVSIIMPFKDECFSVLIRAVHSIINRTPPELLEEIILIDDNSALNDLKLNLEKYAEHFFPKVKLIRLLETHGIMRSRMVGAKYAKSEILVIFDAHIEVGYNWLPPLIEPIALNNKTCTCPYIDKILAQDFSYMPVKGFRGAFDWQFYHHRLPLLLTNDDGLPHLNPVMLGGLFAIGADFFWELGGYDNELQIWGGEQFELSFKIWMCGGTLLDIPCSRVAHAGQISLPIRYRGSDNSAVFRNYMRIAEVWMDDYKKYIYENIPKNFQSVSVGDISAPKAIREKLQCKSFEWYLKEIAFDSLQHYPFVDPASYAAGAITSLGFSKFCISMKSNLDLLLSECANERNGNKRKEQTWLFTEKGEIRKKGENECMDVKTDGLEIYMTDCDRLEGSERWIHNKRMEMIIHASTNLCLESNKYTNVLSLTECVSNNDNLRWKFGWYNESINALQ